MNNWLTDWRVNAVLLFQDPGFHWDQHHIMHNSQQSILSYGLWLWYINWIWISMWNELWWWYVENYSLNWNEQLTDWLKAGSQFPLGPAPYHAQLPACGQCTGWPIYLSGVSFGYNFVIFQRIFLNILHNLSTHKEFCQWKNREDLMSKPPVMSYRTKTAILDFRHGKNTEISKLLKFVGR